MAYDLEFEKPLAEIEKRIQALEKKGSRLKPDDRTRLSDLQAELTRTEQELYTHLTPWQRVQLARHRERPYTLDYIKLICDDFFEMHGDHAHGDDRAIVGGLSTIDGKAVMIVGHQKGRTIQEREERTNGMAHPEGYRKAMRLFKQAERFHMPVLTLIDTSGAYVGLEDEMRGISLAIAESLKGMAALRTPIVCVVIGEGGSGGALGISVGDRILMLEHTVYTVAAPEAAASILWRDASFAPNAAEAMKITSEDLLRLGLIEGVIREPFGGAHRDHQAAAAALKDAVITNFAELQRLPLEQLLQQRYERFRRIGSVNIEQALPVSLPS